MIQKPIRNIEASVKQKLHNYSKERAEDFNLLLTRYAVERLLYRIYRSKYKKSFVLKGAMLFYLESGRTPHRPTRDVDLLGMGEPNLSRVKETFQQICKIKVVNDGLIFNENSVKTERIRGEHEYKGIRVRLIAGMGSARIPLQVDIGFGDTINPPPKSKRLVTILKFPAPSILIYPWETVIAEKFHALVERGMENSRMKDFFDLYHIASTFTISGSKLARAIYLTFKRRQTALPADIPLGLKIEFGNDPVKQLQWNAFTRKLKINIEKTSLDNVVEKLRSFLMPPSKAMIQRDSFEMKWKPGGPWS